MRAAADESARSVAAQEVALAARQQQLSEVERTLTARLEGVESRVRRALDNHRNRTDELLARITADLEDHGTDLAVRHERFLADIAAHRAHVNDELASERCASYRAGVVGGCVERWVLHPVAPSPNPTIPFQLLETHPCNTHTHATRLHRQKLASEMEVAEVRASAELEVQARLLEAAQQEVARREAALSQHEAALADREHAVQDAVAAARDLQQQEGSHLAATEQRTRATQQQLQQQLERMRTEAAELASQRAALEAWQKRLDQQQNELSELEAAAADTLQDARCAASTALAERDQVRWSVRRGGGGEGSGGGQLLMGWIPAMR